MQKTPGFVHCIWAGHWTILASSRDFVASFPACCTTSEDSFEFVHADVNRAPRCRNKTEENFWHNSERYIVLWWPLHSERKALSLCLAPRKKFDIRIWIDAHLQDLKGPMGHSVWATSKGLCPHYSLQKQRNSINTLFFFFLIQEKMTRGKVKWVAQGHAGNQQQSRASKSRFPAARCVPLKKVFSHCPGGGGPPQHPPLVGKLHPTPAPRRICFSSNCGSALLFQFVSQTGEERKRCNLAAVWQQLTFTWQAVFLSSAHQRFALVYIYFVRLHLL